MIQPIEIRLLDDSGMYLGESPDGRAVFTGFSSSRCGGNGRWILSWHDARDPLGQEKACTALLSGIALLRQPETEAELWHVIDWCMDVVKPTGPIN